MELERIEDDEMRCVKLSELASFLDSYYCCLDTERLFVVNDKHKTSFYVHYFMQGAYIIEPSVVSDDSVTTVSDMLSVCGDKLVSYDVYRVYAMNNTDGIESEYDSIHDFTEIDKLIAFITTHVHCDIADAYSDDGWIESRTPDPTDCLDADYIEYEKKDCDDHLNIEQLSCSCSVASDRYSCYEPPDSP